MELNIRKHGNTTEDYKMFTWSEFITDLLQPHNSMEELKRREEDIEYDRKSKHPLPLYDINFKTMKGEQCECELTLHYEGCDYHFHAWVNEEEQKQFPGDALNHFNLELYIKSLYVGEIR